MSNNIGPMNTAGDLPSAVASYLRDFATAARRLAMIRSLGFAVSLFLIWAALCCSLDRLLQLASTTRLALLVSGIVVFLAFVARAIWRMRRRVDWVDVAAQIEEREPRFSQALLTVVSQLTGGRANRGSEEILSHLLQDVESHIVATPRRSSLSAGAVLPWLICLLLIIAAITLCTVFEVGETQLARRFVLPRSDIPPVTTTQIAVSPGDRDIVQSMPLRIDARVQHLSGDSVVLFLNTQGDWYRVVMNSSDGTHFNYPLASVDRDVRYYIAAGDAATRTYLARVLRRPTVSQFQISYVFPAYVQQAPVTVTNTDGLIEAPAGSRATLTVHCSDPLQSALLSIGSEKILMARTVDDSVRQAGFVVRQDTAYSVDLISAREVAGSGPPGTRIHSLVNRPPVARLFQAGQTVRLTPRDMIKLTYQAADDYALTSLSLQVKINNAKPINRAILLVGNPRGQQGGVDLDLGSLRLKIGDVAIVTAVAEDSAGQTSVSEPLRIHVSARPIDLDTRQRVTELDAARGLAAKLLADFEAARDAISRGDGIPDRQSNGFAAASARANLSLANASESATLLRRCLCRTILHATDARLCVFLANSSDSAQILSQLADELFRQRGDPTAVSQPIDVTLQRTIDQAHHLSEAVVLCWKGQLAAALLTETDDAPRQHPPDAQNGALLREMSIDPASANIPQQLREKISAAAPAIAAAHPIDYAAAAQGWADLLSRGEHPTQRLGRRLAAAAEAEALRPDADLEQARDLQLASRAATAIEVSLTGQRPEESAAAATVNALTGALTALEQEWAMRRQAATPQPRAEANSIAAAAAVAREQLMNWAPDLASASIVSAASSRPTTTDSTVSAGKRDAEDLALAASAAAAGKDYDRAARLDQALNSRLGETAAIPGGVTRQPDALTEWGQQRVVASMAAARTIDGIGQTQDAVVQQTRGALSQTAADLAGRERTVADAIAAVVTHRSDSVEPNSREQAVAGLLRVQEQLVAFPQKLADALAAAAALRIANQRASGAQSAVSQLGKDASAEERGMVERAAVEAESESDEASDRLELSMGPMDAGRVTAWADELGAYAPESTSACEAMQTQLVAALTELGRLVHENDLPALNRAAGALRAAVEFVQRELAAAQDALTAHDPLVAARSFAGAAADSLAQSPPDVTGALRQQVQATGALARAWDQSIHAAAAHRLSIVPSLQPVYATTAPGDAARWSGGAAVAGGWGNLEPRQTESINFPGRDSDPVGYEEPLRLYFQAIGKAQANHANGHE